MSHASELEGGEVLLLGLLNTASKPIIPQTYFTPTWGVAATDPIDQIDRWNPFHQYTKLDSTEQATLEGWLPWLKGQEPFLATVPNLGPDATDRVKTLVAEWTRKNNRLRTGYTN
jgi:hypothetical protein